MTSLYHKYNKTFETSLIRKQFLLYFILEALLNNYSRNNFVQQQAGINHNILYTSLIQLHAMCNTTETHLLYPMHQDSSKHIKI